MVEQIIVLSMAFAFGAFLGTMDGKVKGYRAGFKHALYKVEKIIDDENDRLKKKENEKKYGHK